VWLCLCMRGGVQLRGRVRVHLVWGSSEAAVLRERQTAGCTASSTAVRTT
jgi:hypothetical protein